MKRIAERPKNVFTHLRFCAFTLLAFCFLSTAQGKTLGKTAELVPAETALLVNVDNFGQLKGQFEKTNIYKLYKDPAMRAFIEDFRSKWRQKMPDPDNELIRMILDEKVRPEGKLAVALVLNQKAIDTGEPMALFVSQWGQSIAKIKEAVEKQAKKAIEKGLHQTSEDYRGVNIKTIIAKEDARLGLGFSSRISYCFVDDCLIASEDIEILKFAIAHIKGADSPALAGDSDYTATMAAIGPYHDIDVYINIKQIIKTIIANDNSGNAQSVITSLGMDNIAAVGSSIAIGRGQGNSCGGKTIVKINGAKKGICKMLEAESAAFKAPRFIPATSYAVTFLNLDIKKVYSELYNILYSFNPMAASMMHMPLLPPSPDGQPGMELKSGIIDYLGSQIIISQNTNKSSGSIATAESLVALGVDNRSALEKSLSLLHSTMIAANNPDAKRELLGHTIYLINLSGLPFLQGGLKPMQGPADLPAKGMMPTLAFTVTDTHLICGPESTVEQAIRTLSSTDTASVGSQKWFVSAKSSIPSAVGMAALEDTATSSELLWQMIKQSGKAGGTGIPMGPNPQMSLSQAGLDLFDFGLLPQFDAVRKYFGLSTLYGISRPDGFFFEFNYLNPTQTTKKTAQN